MLLFGSIGLLLICFVGCSSKKMPSSPPQFHFEQDAVRIHLEASPQLNVFDGTPHTLFMCIYELTDPNMFNTYLENPTGISDLLACNRFDPSVVNFKRAIIQPGAIQEIVLDRAEGAHYVGIVAGYFLLSKEKAVRLFSIPILTETKGVINKTFLQKPGKLVVELTLGPTGIEQAGVKSEL